MNLDGLSDNPSFNSLVSCLKAFLQTIVEVVTTIAGFAGVELDIDLSGIGVDLDESEE